MPEDTPSDRLRDRAEESRWKLWLTLSADRWLVTLTLSAVVFASFVAVGTLTPEATASIRGSDSIDTLFQGLLTATITGVTLVLTLNQLVLSQELGAVGDQRDRMEGATAFRRDVADAVGVAVAPGEPASLLRALLEAAGERAQRLREAVSGSADDQMATEITSFADAVSENADQVTHQLSGATFGSFGVVAAALDFNYSWKILTTKRLRERHSDQLPAEAREELSALIELLQLYGPAREHVKTLYFQWALINLSRRILVAAVPALLVAGCMVAFFDPATTTGRVAGVETLVIVVSVTATVVLVPFVLLLVSVVRIATVTKRTLSIGPLILRESDDAVATDREE